MIGETIKDFKITHRLGKGGMGEVWVGEQQIVKTRVAIKLLTESRGGVEDPAVQRFFNEAVAADRIRHAGIVKIYDVGFHGPRPYLIMELLDGQPLASAIRQAGRLKLPEVADIGRQLAGVLAAVHAAGITHRDLKPDNIFLVPDAELASGRRVKVLDFGIAKLASAHDATAMTASSSSMGTPAYMAPEQWNDAASADARADVYSLGCIVMEMVRGKPPFVASTIGEACTKHLTEPPPPLTGAPTILTSVVARMLAKDPAARPEMREIATVFDDLAAEADGSALAATLGDTHDAGGTTTLGGAAGQRTATSAPRRRRWLLPALGIVAVAGGLTAFVIARGPSPTTVATVDLDAAAPVAPDAAVLKQPTLGLRTLAQFRDPTGATQPNLRSESSWLATRDDLAEACKQPGAPARWCSGAELAAGQLAMIHDAAAEAVAAYDRAIAIDATWAEPFVALATARAFTGDTDNALVAARRAQRIAPDWWLSFAAGARAYSAASRFPEAIEEYQRALAVMQTSAVLFAEVALVYHGAGLSTESDKFADKALALDPMVPAVHVIRAERALEKNDAKTAIREADIAIAAVPSDLSAHLARGDGYALLRDKAEAHASYRMALELRGAGPMRAADKRIALVEQAIATNKLPPPRNPPKQTLRKPVERSRPEPNGNGKLELGIDTDTNDRARPQCRGAGGRCGSVVR